MSTKTRSHAARLLALFLAFTLVAPALGEPADISQIAAPVLGASPPKAQDIADGDASVSTQTGALNYSFPIRVPPGRNGMVPSLSLDYSSQAAIYGGIAAGWSMSIPDIRWDTSKGRMRYFDTIDQEFIDEPYISNLSGGRPLVAVTEGTADPALFSAYRAKNDSQFISYRRTTPILDPTHRWRALTPEGITHYFGEPSFITNASSTPTLKLTHVRSPLTRSVDPFGNTVEYYWNFDGEELRIDRIRYTTNPNLPAIQAFGEIQFVYDAGTTCGGRRVGSQIDYTTGLRLVDGKSRLTQIVVKALDPSTQAIAHTRQITLGYGATTGCSNTYAPYRQLASIQESAWHTPANRVDMPAVTFEYGAAGLALTSVPGEQLWVGSTPNDNNLGWGHRYQTSQWTSVEATMVDFDGDGLVDRLENASFGNNCAVDVMRNQGNGNFALLTTIPLPRLPWQTADTMNPVVGEGCFVNYQHTKYQNVPQHPCGGDHNGVYVTYRWIDMTGDRRPELVTAVSHDSTFDPTLPGAPAPTGQTWPTCNGNFGACSALQYSCMQSARVCNQGEACEMVPSVLNACIASAPLYACGMMSVEVTGNDDGSTMRTGAGECGPGFNPVWPHKLDCDLYPWVWYRNTGVGIETSTPNTRLQPTSLESDAGDSSISPGAYLGFQQGILDIDGDGFVDSVVRARWDGGGPPPPGVQPYWWWAFLGDGNGGFLKDQITGKYKQYFIAVPDGFWVSRTTGTGTPATSLTSTQQLVDINGDGTVDYLNRFGTANLDVHYNDGLKIRSGAGVTPDYSLTTPIAGPTMSQIDVTVPDTIPPYVVEGTRKAKARLIDIDQDGRPDLYRTDGNSGAASIQFNAGGDFLSVLGLSTYGLGAQQVMLIDGSLNQNDTYTWAVKTDLLDIDGDGIPEQFDHTAATLALSAQNVNGKPPRLMTAVSNGRGLRTDITYAPMSDPNTVDNTVGTNSSASPTTQWVVKQLATTDTFEASPGSTTYFYDDPVYGKNDEGRYAFRGFKTAITTNVRGAKVIERYGFASTESPDWSGRLVSTVTQMPDGTAVSVADHTWQSKTLFGGKVVTYHPLQSTQMTCASGVTEAQCRAAPAGRVVSVSTLTAIANSASVNMLWVETRRTLQDSVAYDDGDRHTITTYQLYSGPYRLRPTKVEQFHRVSGTDQLIASSETTWDATYRVPLLTKQRLDVTGALATAERTFDMDTGNVLTTRKPVQYDSAGPLSTNTYDARKLLVARVVNELAQDRETDYEYGTGAVIAERGPNLRSCDPNCPADPPEAPLPRRDGTRITVDGFGRPTAVEMVTAQGSSLNVYEYALVETRSYTDTATSTVPTSVTGKKLIEYGTTRWTEVKTELDGHGRPIRSTEKVNGTAPVDAITTYDYAEDGTLIVVSMPDPSQNTSAQVTYTYAFDAIGRPTSIRRPDSATPALRSGVDVAYDGLVQTQTEVVAPGDGVPGATKVTRDVYGRLVRVDERTVTTPTTFAGTVYMYSPRNEVTSIVDPTGVTTLLEHDFAGRRTKITRGTRQWKYTYDKNGNLVAEATPPKSSSPPNPPSASDIAAHTTTYVYDALDRMTSKAIAPRELSPADQELFGTTTVAQDWDGGEYNRMGHVVSFRTRGPANVNVLNGRYFYDPEGNTSQSNRTWNIAVTGGKAAFAERGETYRYGPFGALRRTDAADGNGTGTEGNTQINTLFDDRGNPSKLQLLRFGLSSQYVGVQTRNVAGRITKRRTDQPAQTMTFIESNWTYDKLGRITSQVVQKNGPTQVARQDISYFGTDDPKSLDHYLDASNHKKFEFTYDQRHQLLGTAETAAGGAFSASNTFDLAGRFSNAVVTPTNLPGREARPRDVLYVYGAADLEAVSRLTINAGPHAGTPYADYTYDEAGNQISRTYYTTADLQPVPLQTPQTWQFLYDGDNQLRRATSPDGTIEEYWHHPDGQRAMIRTRPASGPISWRWFHDNTEVEWQTDDLNDTTPTLVQTLAYVSLGTPIARVLNRNDRTEYQFHGLASNTLATVESGIGDAASAPASGTVNATFLYSPFGEVLESVGAETTTHRRRVNDKYNDASTSLGYYGARYYDAVSMQWTQADPLTSIVPDTKLTRPRLSSRYAFSLQNPVRYADPDGRQPEQVIQKVHIPSQSEFAKIRSAYRQIAIPAYGRYWVALRNGSRDGQVRAKRDLSTAIQFLVNSFNIDTSGAQVIASSTVKSDHAAEYDETPNRIRVNPILLGGTGTVEEIAYLASVLVHEAVHAATTAEQRKAGGDDRAEFIAYEAGRIYIKMLLDKGLISRTQYEKVLERINSGEEAARKKNEDWCIPCLAMMSMHVTEDLARTTYKRRSVRYYTGLWGLEANPSGPGL